MKKLISILLLLIFIVGCSHLSPKEPDSSSNSNVDEDVVYDNVDSEITESGEKVVTLTEGDTLTYNGYDITVEKLSRNDKLILKIGDQIRVIDETKTDLVVYDIVVYVEQFDFDNSKASVRFKPLVLGDNEYLLKIRGTVDISGSIVTLDQISTDDLHYVTVNVYTSYKQQESGRVKQGETRVIGDVKVTNIKTNPRAISLEKYAILRLEPR
jgi:hypothetical protein